MIINITYINNENDYHFLFIVERRMFVQNILMIYASMSGNTEAMADAIEEGVKEAGGKLTVMDILEVSSASILEQYDGILLVSYTWGDGELPDEFLDIYEEMEELNLMGKKAAVFGSCDSSYPHYGAAVDILMECLKERGAEVVLDGLKVELTPGDEEIEWCKQFGASFVKAFQN